MEKEILIVEDEDDIRNALSIELECEGSYHCVGAPDQMEAVDLLKNGYTPHVVLVDIMMPSSPEAGLELISQLKSENEWDQIPVIVLSARSQSDTILEALRRGAIDYLIKPYDPNELLSRVGRACRLNEEPAFLPAPNHERSMTDPNTDWRQLHVEVMKLSLLYWELTLHKTKADLAEMSGIWSWHIDSKGTYRTKTLDRYLHERTIPKRPRTRQVLQTAHFVLKHCPTEENIRTRLEGCLQNLEAANVPVA